MPSMESGGFLIALNSNSSAP
uniref:Uncharacterized protein n=1 Tax=Rhizophora mucronata TaxID=61149 RepID=A0A2P2NE99_RHIMU